MILLSLVIQNLNNNPNTSPANSDNTNYTNTSNVLTINNDNSKNVFKLFGGQKFNLSIPNFNIFPLSTGNFNFNLTIGVFSIGQMPDANYKYDVYRYVDITSLIKDVKYDYNEIVFDLDYNLDNWPYFGYGVFNLSSGLFPDAFFISNIVIFYYDLVSVNLYPYTPDNLERLDNLHTRDLYNDTKDFINITQYGDWGYYYGVIDQSSVEDFSNQVKSHTAYYQKLNYSIYIGDFNYNNQSYFTEDQVKSILNQGTNLTLDNLFWSFYDTNIYQLKNATSSGWVCFQHLTFDSVKGPLNGLFVNIYQISILDNQFNIEYFDFYVSIGIS